jgi:lipopolysaccharide assembly outer membrane protein LptD (OstA)
MTRKLISQESFTPANDSNRGFFAKRRYYFALSDHYDLTVLGDYYTNGSYGMRFESSYAKDMLIEVI